MKKTLANRLKVLRGAFDQEGLSGLVLNQGAYVYHLTDWLPPSWATVFAVVGSDELILVTPFVPEGIEPAWSAAITTEDTVAGLEQALSQAKTLDGPLGVVMGALPAAHALPLSGQVELRDATELMYDVTAVKDEVARQAIRERVSYLDKAFEVTRTAIEPGVSETEVFGAIFTSLTQSLGGTLTLDCNFGSGPRALGDEPEPTNKLLEAGEAVMIDLFPVMGGYVADYTRNFVVGKPTDGQLAQHAALEKALAAAESILRPGTKASEIDRLVRKTLEDEGWGEFAYQHHTGHAFGLTIPEPPWLLPDVDVPLRAGMVIAVEPGIYHPVNGGMRLEGNYVITDDGPESLVGFPAKLIACE
jgi:Xaa-Pro aminopeptidase